MKWLTIYISVYYILGVLLIAAIEILIPGDGGNTKTFVAVFSTFTNLIVSYVITEKLTEED